MALSTLGPFTLTGCLPAQTVLVISARNYASLKTRIHFAIHYQYRCSNVSWLGSRVPFSLGARFRCNFCSAIRGIGGFIRSKFACIV